MAESVGGASSVFFLLLPVSKVVSEFELESNDDFLSVVCFWVVGASVSMESSVLCQKQNMI